MKDSTIIGMQKDLKNMEVVVRKLFEELNNLKDLAIGTMELLKRMEGFDAALGKLQEWHEEKKQEELADIKAQSGTFET